MDIWNTIIGGGFIIGAIFWAGATYSRIGRIEKDLGGLVNKLGGLTEIGILRAQIETHNDEIVMLRKTVYGDQWRQFGGPRKTRNNEHGHEREE